MTTLDAAVAFCVSNEFAARLIKTIAEETATATTATTKIEATNGRLLADWSGKSCAMVTYLTTYLSALQAVERDGDFVAEVGRRFGLIQCTMHLAYEKSQLTRWKIQQLRGEITRLVSRPQVYPVNCADVTGVTRMTHLTARQQCRSDRNEVI